MNDTDEYHIRCRRLDREYQAVGRDLMRIKVRKASERVGPDVAAKGAIVYSCLFNAACVTLQDTLFGLQAEANEYSATTVSPPITVIGVHEDWLDTGSGAGSGTGVSPVEKQNMAETAIPRGTGVSPVMTNQGRDGHATRRCLWVDGEGVCNDIVLDNPIRIDFVHFLHYLPADEIETHHRLTGALSATDVIAINPAGDVSDVCDSKHKTFGALLAADIPAPATLYFSRFSLPDSVAVAERLRVFMREFDRTYPDEAEHLLFIQPDVGTEARDTFAARVRAGSEPDDSLIDNIHSRSEDTVMRYARGNLFYAGPDSDNVPRRFVIRVNAFKGMSVEELSGYAIVAPDRKQDIVAISQGARKMPISVVLDRLSDRKGVKVDVSPSARNAIYSTALGAFDAVNAASGAADKVLLVGIDLVLELSGEEIAASVIDVNPRAVIAHSTFTTGRGEKLGLGRAWWKDISNLIMSKSG